MNKTALLLAVALAIPGMPHAETKNRLLTGAVFTGIGAAVFALDALDSRRRARHEYGSADSARATAKSLLPGGPGPAYSLELAGEDWDGAEDPEIQ